MIRIAKTFKFSASHQLHHLAASEPDHPCARLHGHNYEVTLILQSSHVDFETNMLRDFRSLYEFKAWIDDHVDHRHLNEVFFDGKNTTSEALAVGLFNAWSAIYPELVGVRVSETPATWAEYWRPGIWP